MNANSKKCVKQINGEFILPLIFGSSKQIIILEIILRNYTQNQNGWLNLSEIARIGKISTSTAKKVIDILIRSEIMGLRENTYQTPVKNPLKEVHLNPNSKVGQGTDIFLPETARIIINENFNSIYTISMLE